MIAKLLLCYNLNVTGLPLLMYLNVVQMVVIFRMLWYLWVRDIGVRIY